MIETKRKPATVGEILVEEFLEPLGITQGDLAEAMGVPRRRVNELCVGRRTVTVDTAMLLAKALDTSAEFWLNAQLRNELWKAKHDVKREARLAKVRQIHKAA